MASFEVISDSLLHSCLDGTHGEIGQCKRTRPLNHFFGYVSLPDDTTLLGIHVIWDPPSCVFQLVPTVECSRLIFV